jgi:tRNA (guanine37-N1)-methyltransferase
VRAVVVTLFPSWFDWFVEQRHVRNAGLALEAVDLRATTPLAAGKVDDTPYGGGAGMVIRVDVVAAALEARFGGAAETVRDGRPVVLMAASGRPFTDAVATELATHPELVLICGRYEGVDARVEEHLCSDAISIGPYVLSGGEIAAMAVLDATARKLPDALGNAASLDEESWSPGLDGAAEYPQYTRPFDFRGWTVPEILRSGDHAAVARWRAERARTGRDDSS